MGALWADTKAWYELHSQTGNKEETGCRGRRGEVERWQANNCAKLMMRHSAAKTKGQGDTTNSSRSNSCTTNRIRGGGKGQGARASKKKGNKLWSEGQGRGVANGSYPLPWQSVERCRVASGIDWKKKKYSARMDFRLCVLPRRRGCCRVKRKGGEGAGRCRGCDSSAPISDFPNFCWCFY